MNGVDIPGCTFCELPDAQKLEEAISIPAMALCLCGLPRPSTMALSYVLPNVFPMDFSDCCPTTKPVPSAYGVTPAITYHGNVSARVCWLCLLATSCLPWSSTCTCYPNSLQQSSAPDGHIIHGPWTSPVCCQGPLALRTIQSLCSSGVVPSPSPKSAANTSVSCQDPLPSRAAVIISQNEKGKVPLFICVPHRPLILSSG